MYFSYMSMKLRSINEEVSQLLYKNPGLGNFKLPVCHNLREEIVKAMPGRGTIKASRFEKLGLQIQ